MTQKPNGKMCRIAEQIIKDVDVTIQFELRPDGMVALRMFGDVLTCGNRELLFAPEDGRLTATGTHMTGLCKPTWYMDSEADDDGG